MKPADLRAMTVDMLDDEALKLKKERFNLRFQRATGQLENTARVRQVRRDIARMKTIAAQKRSGKGAPELWVARIKPGRILFEIDGVPLATARESLALAAAKLPIKTRFVERIAE